VKVERSLVTKISLRIPPVDTVAEGNCRAGMLVREREREHAALSLAGS
jgi:hypothetical protein